MQELLQARAQSRMCAPLATACKQVLAGVRGRRRIDPPTHSCTPDPPPPKQHVLGSARPRPRTQQIPVPIRGPLT
eukprot:12360336-Alexandrium_andersonii.AAC.1